MQNTMEYGRAFTFPQQETDWVKKFLIGGVLSLVPLVGNLLFAGYTLEVTRRVINGDPQVMPEWSDFGGLFKKGLSAFVVGLVYALPIIVAAFCAFIPAAALGSQEDQTLQTIGSVISVCFGCIVFLYSVGLGLVLPAAFAKLAATGEIGAALRVGDVINLVRAKPAVYLIVWLLSGIATSMLISIGSIACGIGATFGAAYGLLATAHLHGQAYRVASAEGGLPAAAAPAM